MVENNTYLLSGLQTPRSKLYYLLRGHLTRTLTLQNLWWLRANSLKCPVDIHNSPGGTSLPQRLWLFNLIVNMNFWDLKNRPKFKGRSPGKSPQKQNTAWKVSSTTIRQKTFCTSYPSVTAQNSLNIWTSQKYTHAHKYRAHVLKIKDGKEPMNWSFRFGRHTVILRHLLL